MSRIFFLAGALGLFGFAPVASACDVTNAAAFVGNACAVNSVAVSAVQQVSYAQVAVAVPFVQTFAVTPIFRNRVFVNRGFGVRVGHRVIGRRNVGIGRRGAIVRGRGAVVRVRGRR